MKINEFNMQIKQRMKNMPSNGWRAFLSIILIIIVFCKICPAQTVQHRIGLFSSLKTSAPLSSVTVVKIYPHDADAFTQGFLFHQNFFYESSGLVGKSFIVRKKIESGQCVQKIRIDGDYFAEGIARIGNKLYLLTWQNETLLIYDVRTLRENRRMRYQGEGWGLTSDGKYLLMSNGSPIIAFRDPDTFRVIREIHVHDGDVLIGGLNEMEFIKNEIWANIFTKDLIARISPANGKVTGWIDLSSLRSYLPNPASVDVLNGIAYDAKTDRIFVTGKLWPMIFEIRLVK